MKLWNLFSNSRKKLRSIIRTTSITYISLEKQDFIVFDNIPETNTYHTKTKDRTISYHVKSSFEKT